MVYHPYLHKPPAGRPNLELGPRLRHDLERQVRELSRRLHPTSRDLRELERLRSLLKGGRQDGGL
jgi:hypothetical protein